MSMLRSAGNPENVAGQLRVGITGTNPLGVSMGDIRRIAKSLGRSHELAQQLWATQCQDARILAAFVAIPAQVTPDQMDHWTKEIDNWALCDALCMHLYDRTPYAWKKIVQWAEEPEEFVRRASFALLATVACHDKKAHNERFLDLLPLIEKHSVDDRNYVKKAVSWALRHIGKRNPDLRAAAMEVADRLARSANSASRWIGRDALRELESYTFRKDRKKR